ncbi:alg13 UDP-N-acetylglucosaminyltransferase subunit [Oratosquilla oratoria]|uniref:alg13 UDP-N-acetylglucosaminyltransferase subunit n=1 Tax=Oratosquilla oratoria TaxID=337810 RepID=UPI003F763643
MEKTVFVTVGTTKFEKLISAVMHRDTLAILKSKGYTRVILQIGQGENEPKEGITEGVQIEVFRLKPSISNYFVEADLVISHAGAGSCMEALSAGKPLIAVINDLLIDNHQQELAEKFYECGYSLMCTPGTLQETLKEFDAHALIPYMEAHNPTVVGNSPQALLYVSL